MKRSLLPYPSGDWKSWALQLIDALQERQDIESENFPQPVQLARLEDNAKATTDGVVLYSPQLGKSVISINGVWEPIALDRAVFFRGTYDDYAVTDDWTTLPNLNPPVVIVDSGVFKVDLTFLATGTLGGASYQIRLTVDDVDYPELTSPVLSIGNGEIRQTSTSFFTPSTVGTLRLQARGAGTTLSLIRSYTFRIGQ